MVRRQAVLRWIIAGMVLCAATPTVAAEDPSLRKLASDISAIAREHGVRGGGFALVQRGRITILRSFGHADADRSNPVTDQTLFRVGSISKTVTALLALAVVEDGHIGLSSPVADVLPAEDVPESWATDPPLRLVHLLEHTGGLPGTSYFEYTQQGENVTPAAYLTRLRDRLSLRWAPGMHYSYSNGGYTIAALMLERKTGQPFDALVANRIFSPLGMQGATFSTHGARTNDHSESFAADGAAVPPWPMAIRPAGALAASLKDMARLTLFLATEGESVGGPPVSPDGLRRMRQGETSLPARFGYDYAYGLGMFAFVAANRIFWGHWGKTEGFLANLGVRPAERSGFVLLSNTSNRKAMTAMRERLARHLTQNSEIPTTQAAPGSPDSDKFSGLYLPFTHDMSLRSWIFAIVQATVVDSDGQVLSAGPLLPIGKRTELVAESERFFRPSAFPVATYLFLDDDGRTLMFGDAQDTYRKLGDRERIALSAALLIFPLVVVGCIVASAIIPVARIFGIGSRELTVMISSFGAASALLLALFAVFAKFALAAPLHDLAALGEPSLRSGILLTLSVLWPLCAALGIFLLWRYWRTLSAVSRGGGLLVGATFLATAATLLWLDWLPLITWHG